jgi:hypothetical protein
VTLSCKKKLVNTTDSQESEVKDEDNVADDVLDLLVKDEHVDGVENTLNGLAPLNTNSKRSKVVHDPKIRARMPSDCQSLG